MSKLPNERFLSLYWIPYVGIGSHLQKVYVPLTDVLNYKLANGKPQASLVYLFAGTLNDASSEFSRPYINIEDGILKELTPQDGEAKSNVQKLQDAGVKVVLSVLGSSNMGWSNIPSNKQADFASWVQSDIIQKYSLDGIDIDDEGSNLPQDPQNFVNTVAHLREVLGDSLMSKALWSDSAYFTLPVSSGVPLSGSYFAELLDFGATMGYGYDYNRQLKTLEGYHNFTNDSGEKVGMPYDKLCVGVQAGPPSVPPGSNWMTPIDETAQLAQWAVQKPIMGMMLFTFSQDIQQFDEKPQNQDKYKWPNPDDHRWQKAIISEWYE